MSRTETPTRDERTQHARTGDRVSVNVSDRVRRPVHDVFTAIVDPTKLSRFFISSASGPLKAGEKVDWVFADVGANLSVDVKEIVPDSRIVFGWTASGTTAAVTIALEPRGPNATLVRITEEGWPLDRDGVKRALGQTAGWTDFICCMKADLQHGINLRAGRSKEDH
jgi:uncharacterized protein YndB with AHSA1/START domain